MADDKQLGLDRRGRDVVGSVEERPESGSDADRMDALESAVQTYGSKVVIALCGTVVALLASLTVQAPYIVDWVIQYYLPKR